MPHIRLIGLALFITTVFLAMAAAATQTTHIRFKRPGRAGGGQLRQFSSQTNDPAAPPSRSTELVLPPGVQTPASEISAPKIPAPEISNSDRTEANLQFVSVPVVYPLLIAGASGLGLWFVPASRSPTTPKRKRRRQRRRR